MLLKYVAAAALAGTLVMSACSSESKQNDVVVTAVTPQQNSVNVAVGTKVSMTFSHAMMQGMEQYLMLHEGSADGPGVAGAWSWSGDSKTLTFTPAAPLKSQTKYIVHLQGGMMNAAGSMVTGIMMNGTMAHGGMNGEMTFGFTTS